MGVSSAELSCDEFTAYASRVDTQYFGIASAKAVLMRPVARVDQQDALLSYLSGFQFVIINNQESDPVNHRWLGERTSAFLADINVQLRKELPSGATETSAPARHSIIVTDMLPDNPQIVRIAETDFSLSQFRNDPYLPQEKARRIYGDIVQNAFGKPGRFFVVAETAGRVSGFLLYSPESAAASATIRLIVVSQEFLRQGVGHDLLNGMENAIRRQEIRTIVVGTQFNNYGALRFYQSSGFVYISNSAIYHYWPSIPKASPAQPDPMENAA